MSRSLDGPAGSRKFIERSEDNSAIAIGNLV
jgi:hypothetical protein